MAGPILLFVSTAANFNESIDFFALTCGLLLADIGGAMEIAEAMAEEWCS